MSADPIERQIDAALDLAIARYLRDRDPGGEADEWRTPQVQEWVAAPPGALEREAAQRKAELERWREAPGGGRPEAWESRRVEWLQALQWLGSARTGSFTTSSGRLFDFLVAVGEPTREFEIF